MHNEIFSEMSRTPSYTICEFNMETRIWSVTRALLHSDYFEEDWSYQGPITSIGKISGLISITPEAYQPYLTSVSNHIFETISTGIKTIEIFRGNQHSSISNILESYTDSVTTRVSALRLSSISLPYYLSDTFIARRSIHEDRPYADHPEDMVIMDRRLVIKLPRPDDNLTTLIGYQFTLSRTTTPLFYKEDLKQCIQQESI